MMPNGGINVPFVSLCTLSLPPCFAKSMDWLCMLLWLVYCLIFAFCCLSDPIPQHFGVSKRARTACHLSTRIGQMSGSSFALSSHHLRCSTLWWWSSSFSLLILLWMMWVFLHGSRCSRSYKLYLNQHNVIEITLMLVLMLFLHNVERICLVVQSIFHLVSICLVGSMEEIIADRTAALIFPFLTSLEFSVWINIQFYVRNWKYYLMLCLIQILSHRNRFILITLLTLFVVILRHFLEGNHIFPLALPMLLLVVSKISNTCTREGEEKSPN